jgi:hypothetical protein
VESILKMMDKSNKIDTKVMVKANGFVASKLYKIKETKLISKKQKTKKIGKSSGP